MWLLADSGCHQHLRTWGGGHGCLPNDGFRPWPPAQPWLCVPPGLPTGLLLESLGRGCFRGVPLCQHPSLPHSPLFLGDTGCRQGWQACWSTCSTSQALPARGAFSPCGKAQQLV